MLTVTQEPYFYLFQFILGAGGEKIKKKKA